MRRVIIILTMLGLFWVGSVSIAAERQNYPRHQKGMMNQYNHGRTMDQPRMPIRCMRYYYMMFVPGSEAYKNYKKFLKETLELRAKLAAKRAELYVLVNRSNSDPEKIANLAKDIVILEDRLRDHAFKYNLPDPCPMMRQGMGYMFRYRHIRGW